jgi:hypothetical protein
MANMEERLEPCKKFPVCVLLFSGKRKSGKDYITDKIFDR